MINLGIINIFTKSESLNIYIEAHNNACDQLEGLVVTEIYRKVRFPVALRVYDQVFDSIYDKTYSDIRNGE